jgi:hypothetical protein
MQFSGSGELAKGQEIRAASGQNATEDPIFALTVIAY